MPDQHVALLARRIHSSLQKEVTRAGSNRPQSLGVKSILYARRSTAVLVLLAAYLVRDAFMGDGRRSTTAGKISAIHVPDGTISNLYQRLLANSLRDLGVEVQFAKATDGLSLLTTLVTHWRPQVVHIHWQHPFLLANGTVRSIIKSCKFVVELLVLKGIGVRLVWTAHNITNHEKRYECVERFFTRLLAHQCHAVIAHSQSAKESVESALGLKNNGKVTVIPHGSFLGCYANEIDRGEARRRLGISICDSVFLFFGLIRPYKGVMELVEAFERLKPEHGKLVIAGSPYGDNGIVARILSVAERNRDLIVIPKFIPDNEIQVFMNASDVVVLPYRDILTSGAAVLAMSFGKPIIAPAIGCIPDLVDSSGAFLYDPRDNNGLSEAMRTSLKANLFKMGEHNLELAKKLDWSHVGKRTLEVYLKCLGEPPAGER